MNWRTSSMAPGASGQISISRCVPPQCGQCGPVSITSPQVPHRAQGQARSPLARSGWRQPWSRASCPPTTRHGRAPAVQSTRCSRSPRGHAWEPLARSC
jgi:hypothetical protein